MLCFQPKHIFFFQAKCGTLAGFSKGLILHAIVVLDFDKPMRPIITVTYNTIRTGSNLGVCDRDMKPTLVHRYIWVPVTSLVSYILLYSLFFFHAAILCSFVAFKCAIKQLFYLVPSIGCFPHFRYAADFGSGQPLLSTSHCMLSA